MKFIVLYLLLLKATLTSFSGLAGLPVLRDDLVLQHHMLTDRELNQAVAIGRVTPGPKGSYIMSVGYYAGGIPGGIAAWLALVTPAILIIPMLSLVGRYTKDPRVQRTLRAVVLASAGISLSATLPLVSVEVSFSSGRPPFSPGAPLGQRGRGVGGAAMRLAVTAARMRAVASGFFMGV